MCDARLDHLLGAVQAPYVREARKVTLGCIHTPRSQGDLHDPFGPIGPVGKREGGLVR